MIIKQIEPQPDARMLANELEDDLYEAGNADHVAISLLTARNIIDALRGKSVQALICTKS